MTPEDLASAMVADAAWAFEIDPVRAITHASARAATAERRGDTRRAAFWTEVGVALCAAGGREPGLVLSQLVERHGG